jgi:proteasome lid subunit RPN8/RPN11
MLSESRIRLSAPEEPKVSAGPIPIAQSRYWRAPHEEGVSDASPAVAVFMTPRAYVHCCRHAGSDMSNEVGGGLAGKRLVDTETGQPFIVIEAAIPARYTRQGSAYLTFTQDTLVALHDELEERHPGKELLGWYHTHPRMDVFLSGYDVWLHQHFFPNPWQVALVIEPHTSKGGFFVWQNGGRLDPRRYVGFYELTRDGLITVVHWRNLRAEAAAAPPEGGPT